MINIKHFNLKTALISSSVLMSLVAMGGGEPQIIFADSVTEVPSTTVQGLKDLKYGDFTFPKETTSAGYSIKKGNDYIPGTVLNSSKLIGTFGMITSKDLTNAISLDSDSNNAYYIFCKNGNSYKVSKDPLNVADMHGDEAIYGGYNSDFTTDTSKTVDGMTFNNLAEYQIRKTPNNILCITSRCRVTNNDLENTPIAPSLDKGLDVDLNKAGNSYSVDKDGNVTVTTDGKTYHFTKNLVDHSKDNSSSTDTKPNDTTNSHSIANGVNTKSNVTSVIVNGKSYSTGTEEQCPTIEIPKTGSVDVKLVCKYNIIKSAHAPVDDVATAIKNVGGVYIGAQLKNALGTNKSNKVLVNSPSGTVTIDLGNIPVDQLGNITAYLASEGSANDGKSPMIIGDSVVKFKQVDTVSSSSSSKSVSSSKSSSSSKIVSSSKVIPSSSSVKSSSSKVSSSSKASSSNVVSSSSSGKSSSVNKVSSNSKSSSSSKSSSVKESSSSKAVSSSSLESSSSLKSSSLSNKESSSSISSSSKESSTDVKAVPSSEVSSSTLKSESLSSKPESSQIENSKVENQATPVVKSNETPSTTTPATSSTATETTTTTNTTTSSVPEDTYSPQKAAMLAKTNAIKEHAGLLTAIGVAIGTVAGWFGLKKKND